MKKEQVTAMFENGVLDSKYADYIMENGDPSERMICNGDTLINAMEDGYLRDAFINSLVG